MSMRTFPLLLISLLLIRVTPAIAQLTSAELYVDVDAGVSADDEDLPLQQASFHDGPRFEDIFLESGTIPWDLDVEVGGGQAETTGQIVYLATNTSQIYTTGNFTTHAAAASPASAIAGFDAVMRIAFEVETVRTFQLTGYVSTGRALDGPEVVACQYNGVVLAGDSRAEPLAPGVYPIDAERTLYPGEVGSLECAAASSGGQSDSNTLEWQVAVEGLPEADTGMGMLAAGGALATIGRRRKRRSG